MPSTLRLYKHNIAVHIILSQYKHPATYMHHVHTYPFVAASRNSHFVLGNEVACNCCEMLTYIKGNNSDIIFVNEAWLSAEVTNENCCISTKWI